MVHKLKAGLSSSTPEWTPSFRISFHYRTARISGSAPQETAANVVRSYMFHAQSNLKTGGGGAGGIPHCRETIATVTALFNSHS